jgi:MoxR-like ATPase
MLEKFKYSPKEIAGRVVKKMKGESVEKSSKKLKPEALQDNVDELSDLIMEKQDLIQSLNSDQEFLSDKKTEQEFSQDDILQAIENLDFQGMDLREFNQEINPDRSIKDSSKETNETLKEVKSKISELMSNKQVSEEYENQLEKRIEWIKLARDVENLEKLIEKIDFSEMKFLAHRSQEDVKLTKADKEVLNKNQEICEKANSKIAELMNNEEVHYWVNRRKILDYRNQLEKSGIVETQSVKNEIDKIMAHLQLGVPVFLRGHLGAGKTEICLHVARKYFGVEPEFISGSEEATKYDIYGKTQIGVRNEEDKIKEFKLRMDEFKMMNPEITEKELKGTEKQYYDEIVVRGQTSSFFQYGPLVRAMNEGKPLVIDEIDGIPHSILMRLNHVLTRKEGDRIKIQENGGEEIVIKKGFCVMATGNIKSAKYKREDLDAAFLSRWWSDEIKYLPQEEIMQVVTASLVDKRGDLDIDIEKFESIKKLIQSAEEIQKIFTGEKTDVFGEGGDAARGVSANLEKSVLSMRDIWNIVRAWKAKNFDKSLDDYILNEFIKKSTVPHDQIYLTQLFCRFGFFNDWDAEKIGISGLDESKLRAFKASR